MEGLRVKWHLKVSKKFCPVSRIEFLKQLQENTLTMGMGKKIKSMFSVRVSGNCSG